MLHNQFILIGTTSLTSAIFYYNKHIKNHDFILLNTLHVTLFLEMKKETFKENLFLNGVIFLR